MILLTSVFLLFTFNKVGAQGPTTLPPICPDENAIKPNCFCYEATGFMSCDNIDDVWIKNFNLKSLYKLETLVIKNSSNLPLLIENSHTPISTPTLTPAPPSYGFTAKTVIFSLDKKINSSVPPDNIDALVKMAQKSLEITYINSEKPLTINAQNLNPNLTSLSLSNVQVNNLDSLIQKSMNKLKNLKLNKVSLDRAVKRVIINQPSLTYIEITNCPDLSKSFEYVPPQPCDNEKQIVLNLQNNINLETFDLSQLFKDNKCRYHIDLSGSKKLNKKFLISNTDTLKTIKAGNLYIILRDVDLDCSKCIFDWYKKMPHYIHSVYCKARNNTVSAFLDQYKSGEELPDKCTV